MASQGRQAVLKLFVGVGVSSSGKAQVAPYWIVEEARMRVEQEEGGGV